MELPAQGWQPDPFGRHEQRWMSAGRPTALVRDGTEESRDPPTGSAPQQEPEPPRQRRWIDVDRLPKWTRQPRPWPVSRLPPSYPTPEPNPRRLALAIVLAGCSVFVTLALHFGHAILPPAPLGRDEVVGQVTEVNTLGSAPLYMVSYSLPRDPGFSGIVLGTWSNVRDGQQVVVRYDPKHPNTASVAATSLPQNRLTLLGWIVVPVAFALALWSWATSGYRFWRRNRQRDEETDYRADVWAGTTNSA